MSIAQQLREQFEYYFSFVNLTTDKYMLSTMQRSIDGSISVQELLQFKRVREMLLSCFEFELTWAETEDLLEVALRDSSKLVMSDGQIKPKRRFNWQRDRKRVLYVEGQNLTKRIFLALLQSLQVSPDSTYTRHGKDWLLAEFPTLNQPQISHLVERLTQTAPAELKLKIIRIDEFNRYLHKFNELFYPENKYRN